MNRVLRRMVYEVLINRNLNPKDWYLGNVCDCYIVLVNKHSHKTLKLSAKKKCI